MSGRPYEPLSPDRTYDKALTYLYNLQKFGIKFGLSQTKNLLRAFGDPQGKLSFVHIAGSNGKGSVAAMISSIYAQAGYRVGLFTSPHLVDFRERFQINGRMISKSQALRLIREIKAKTDPQEPPTFFEFVTAMALIWFEREKVDLAVMETGLGGRLDATNVIRPLISIITTVSLEHQDLLGRTLEKIAWEKAGIIKKGVPMVSGVGQAKIRRLYEDICRERKAPLFLAGRDFRTKKRDNGTFNYYGMSEGRFGVQSSRLRTPKYKGLKTTLLGDHQIKNAALALTAVELLRERFPVTEEQIRRGLAEVTWPGRLEVFSENPRIVLDGAHNPEAMRVLARVLPRTISYRKLLLVFGMMKDKNIRRTLAHIAPLADRIFFTRAEYDRSAEPERLSRLFDGAASEICSSVPLAIQRAVETAGPEDLILVTGSLFIVGEARAFLGSR
jgi:dihydrofolate synthase/folylpolyglutamate synthase